MAIGIRHGTNEPSVEKRERSYDLARKLYEQFKLKHGSVMCRELTGYDFRNPEDLEKARQARVTEKKCVNFVRTAVETLVDLMER